MDSQDAILYACGKGREKQWARESIIIDYLKNNKPEYANYLYIENIHKLKHPDKKQNGKLIYRFGYLFRIPKTEINLTIDESSGRISICEDEIGYGKDEVYEKVFEFLKQQIDIKNLYIKTNLNDNRYLIK